MPTFQYKAKNLKGEELAGVFEAVSQDSLEFMLREKGYFLVASSRQGKEVSVSNLFGKVSVKDLAVFSRQFSVLINSGITILESIGILREQVEKKRLKDVLDEIHEDMQKGRVLSEAMANFPEVFPDFMMNMIKVGEAGGALDMVLNRIADYYENDARIRRKVRGAMTYPAILAVLTVSVVILLMVKIIPMFSGILSDMGGTMPLITRILMGISSFITGNALILLIVTVGIIVGFSYWKQSESGHLAWDALKLKMPIVKTTATKIVTARFARSLAILLKSGIPIINAMEIIGNLIGNKEVERRFLTCRDEIKEGKGISVPMQRLNIFPPLLIHMVSVGESTGELDEMLSRTAGFFDEEVEESIERLTAMVEPAMIIIMAGVVGTVILSVMLPMISVLSVVQ